MENLKGIIGIICRTFGAFGFGFAANRMFAQDYKIASWTLLIVSILFMVGYFAERWIQ
jgi:hypothetical protein